MTEPRNLPKIELAKRCSCGCAIFYDWGLVLLTTRPYADLRGGDVERFRDWAETDRVKICARCNTPYIIQAGELVDLSDELGPEDVQAILARGQATLPHPKIKDP